MGVSGTSWGFELEFASITRNMIRNSRELAALSFRDDHDASIETPVSHLGNLNLTKVPKMLQKRLQRGHTGAELVSTVFTEQNPLDIFKMVTNWASINGETPREERCGIHYHVSLDYDISILRKVMLLAPYLEDVFFQVGGMGYEFRGQSNDSTFCRPITKKGVIVTSNGRWKRPTFVLDDLVASKNTDEFWRRYGDTSHLGGMRYSPVRYHWINLYSLYKQGSLEFRIFNSTLNPHHMWAALELCRTFTKYVIETPEKVLKKLPINSVYDNRSKEEIVDTLREFCEEAMIDDVALNLLEDLINQTPEIRIKNEHVLTHLRNPPALWQSDTYKPKTITAKVKKPHFVDIHNFDRQGRAVNPAPQMRRRVRANEPVFREEGMDERLDNVFAVNVDNDDNEVALPIRVDANNRAIDGNGDLIPRELSNGVVMNSNHPLFNRAAWSVEVRRRHERDVERQRRILRQRQQDAMNGDN